jgi:hypothetical protein
MERRLDEQKDLTPNRRPVIARAFCCLLRFSLTNMRRPCACETIPAPPYSADSIRTSMLRMPTALRLCVQAGVIGHHPKSRCENTGRQRPEAKLTANPVITQWS